MRTFRPSGHAPGLGHGLGSRVGEGAVQEEGEIQGYPPLRVGHPWLGGFDCRRAAAPQNPQAFPYFVGEWTARRWERGQRVLSAAPIDAEQLEDRAGQSTGMGSREDVNEGLYGLPGS